MDRTYGRDGSRRREALVLLMTIVLFGTALITPGTLTPVMAEHRGGLPDLEVLELYNVTEVIVGEECYFNVTIANMGSAAYLLRSSGDLEVYAYRDGDTKTVVSFYRVYDDIYVGKNLTINMKVRYDSVGDHSIMVVIDELDRVDEEDEGNNKAVLEFEAFPSGENRRPHADGGNDKNGYLGHPMLFSGFYSTDPDGDTLTYSWDFGDGSEGNGMYTNHTYDEVGDYSGSLTVSDGELTDKDNFTIHITEAPVNNPPTAVITTSSTNVDVDVDVTLNGLESTDPDQGDKLVYDWDYDASNGVDDWVRGPTVVTSWGSGGTYTVTLRVSDGKVRRTTTVEIKVDQPPPVNKKPTASAGEDVELEKMTTYTFLGVGSDPDGEIVTYEWDVDGDGVYDTYNEDNGDLTHVFTSAGIINLKLRVTDDGGATATDTIVVRVTEEQQGTDIGGGISLMLIIFVFIGLVILLLVSYALKSRRIRG